MNKRIIGFVILALVYFFPFRWAFLDYPETAIVRGHHVDGGKMLYIFFFLLTVFGFLAFLFLTTKGQQEQKEK